MTVLNIIVVAFIHPLKRILPAIILFSCVSFLAQTKVHCGAPEVMQTLYNANNVALKEAEAFEQFTRDFISMRPAATATDCFVIPVVFHVYGTIHNGKTVNNAVIANALTGVNADFHGVNSDFNTVHNSFNSIKASMPDITFALAQFDPDGNPTTGIVYYPVMSGFGNANGYDALIAADAWDNTRYMNVYIQNDLYANNVFNNSGVAWYPNSFMTSNNTARVVYNGAYLGTNTDAEFASVLTHEFAHWLNLIHTFEGGCSGSNDLLNDTPSCDFSGASYGCHASPTSTGPVSCGHLVNAENYMDYSGASGCYKMFTVDQSARMYAALQHPARITLWQPSNVIAAGLWSICSPAGLSAAGEEEGIMRVYPNPATEKIHFSAGHELVEIEVLNELGERCMRVSFKGNSGEIDVMRLASGIYFVRFVTDTGTEQHARFIKR